MTKKEFLEKCEYAIENNLSIVVSVEIPGNDNLEEIFNSKEDVLNKKRYYDAIYDDDMKHKHGPVVIKDINVVASVNYEVVQ